jgi:hypothetical protein
MTTQAFLLEDVMCAKFNRGIDMVALWAAAADKPVQKYNIADVRHWIYSPCWSKDDCFISPYQVLMQPKKFPDHIRRIKAADLAYPLIVVEDDFDRHGGTPMHVYIAQSRLCF